MKEDINCLSTADLDVMAKDMVPQDYPIYRLLYIVSMLAAVILSALSAALFIK